MYTCTYNSHCTFKQFKCAGSGLLFTFFLYPDGCCYHSSPFYMKGCYTIWQSCENTSNLSFPAIAQTKTYSCMSYRLKSIWEYCVLVIADKLRSKKERIVWAALPFYEKWSSARRLSSADWPWGQHKMNLQTHKKDAQLFHYRAAHLSCSVFKIRSKLPFTHLEAKSNITNDQSGWRYGQNRYFVVAE